MATDGNTGGVDITYNDRYCLDGQRLILVSGTYGYANSEYRTERDTLTKIVAYNAVGSYGPAYFIAKTKSGQTIQYGVSTDARIIATGKTTALVWNVNRITDTVGNYLTVTYTQNTATGEYYPQRIDYAGNSTQGTPTSSSVQFVYATRTDTFTGYVGGSTVSSTQRITNVQVFEGATKIRDYGLTYDSSAATQRSRVAVIQECDGAATPSCLPATTVGWQGGGSNNFAPATAWATATGWAGQNYYGFQDMNGDGLADFWWVPNNTAQIKVQLSTGTGFAPATVWTTATGWAGAGYYGFQDMNGDGLADFWWVPNNTAQIKVQLSTGTGFAPATVWTTATGWAGAGYYGFQDMNGDGLADFWWVPSNTAQINVASELSSLDKAASLTTGLGNVTSLSYKPLTNSAGTVYTKGTGAVFPQQDFRGPMYVVSQFTASDGVGGSYPVTYSYQGARVNVQGHGFSGFSQITATDTRTGIVTQTSYADTTYASNWPLFGLATKVTQSYNGATISSQTNVLSFYQYGTANAYYYFPVVPRTVVDHYELSPSGSSYVVSSGRHQQLLPRFLCDQRCLLRPVKNRGYLDSRFRHLRKNHIQQLRRFRDAQLDTRSSHQRQGHQHPAQRRESDPRVILHLLPDQWTALDRSHRTERQHRRHRQHETNHHLRLRWLRQ